MKNLRFAIFGAGFWAQFQLAAWRELEGVKCVAVYNRTRSKAESFARRFGIEYVYDDPRKLLEEVDVDFVDIITDVSTHSMLTSLAADFGRDVICQKPMAETYEDAVGMLHRCNAAGVKLFIHENFRWQSTIRELRRVLEDGSIGKVFRAGIDMISGFPVFENQPFLRELEQFIITDLGSHTIDVARFLFGEASDITCWTGSIHEDIKGEDHATIVMRMGATEIPVIIRMAYAENYLERECFPQTLFFIEGSKGTVEVAPDYQLRLTTERGTHIWKAPPPYFDWADPRYAVVHSSIVPCNADILKGLRGAGEAETTGGDNLRTVQLVHAAYASAANRQTIKIK